MNLLPIETAPKDGTWILLFGPSGYTTTPLRCEVCRWYPEYRPLNPWQNHSDEAFTDGGSEPTHWCQIPSVPQDVVLPEKTIAKKNGCYYCPECGHKFWELKTESGEFMPTENPCRYCVAEMCDDSQY
jgi:hypothetical protein